MTEAGKKQILVVDDDVDIIRIVSRMLTSDDYDIETAQSGEDALEKIALRPPDLILLDIMMPRMNGIEVLRKVRETKPDIKIIMITAFGDIDTYLDAMEWGALEYINKPFESEELLKMVRKILTAA